MRKAANKVITEQAEAEALEAASQVIALLSATPSSKEYRTIILRAIVAVRRVQTETEQRIGPDKYLVLDIVHIVASALYGRETATEGEQHPYCQGAVAFLGFAQAISALEAMSNFQLAIADADVPIWADEEASVTLDAVLQREDVESRRAENKES